MKACRRAHAPFTLICWDYRKTLSPIVKQIIPIAYLAKNIPEHSHGATNTMVILKFNYFNWSFMRDFSAEVLYTCYIGANSWVWFPKSIIRITVIFNNTFRLQSAVVTALKWDCIIDWYPSIIQKVAVKGEVHIRNVTTWNKSIAYSAWYWSPTQ